MNEEREVELKELLKKGNYYRHTRRYDDAIKYYNKAAEKYPESKLVYYNRGLTYGEQEKYEDAIKEYTKAIEIDANYVDVYNSRAIVYKNQGEYEKAEEDCKRALEIDANYVKNYYYYRAMDYYDKDRYNERAEEFTKVIEIDPNYVDAYFGRGLCYHYQNRYKEAFEDYTKAIDIDSNYKKAYNNRGIIYYHYEKYKEAIKDYTKAIEIDEDFALAYNNRISAYRKIKDIEGIEKDLYKLKIIEIKSKDEKFYQYIEKSKNDIKQKTYIYDLYLRVMELKNKLLYKECREVGHYTKISNIKYLLKPTIEENNDDMKHREARLRLNNVAYMNDPTEGEIFIELINQFCENKTKKILDIIYKNQSEDSRNREILNGKNHVFLVSFSSAIDKLPMWVQYSDNGKGCCLVFNPSFFDKEDKNSFSHMLSEDYEKLLDIDSRASKDAQDVEDKKTYYCLYKVKYIENNNNKYKHNLRDSDIVRLMQVIGEKLVVFEDVLKEDRNLMIGIIQNILDQVRFLFKDKSYEHEEEVRLVKFEDNGNVKYTGDTEGFIVPHVYIELDRELTKDKINEVILGPKVENAIEIANYLYYTDKVNIVTRSKIKYK